jgi:hypothetical protein
MASRISLCIGSKRGHNATWLLMFSRNVFGLGHFQDQWIQI